MVAATDFAHLHLHSQYSLLDGAIRVDELLPTIAAQGMQAVAVTDHGNMFSAVHFYKAAQKHGIKPIIGCEAYVAERGRQERSCRDSAHLVLLAKDNEGYKNLSYLISMGYTEGFYYNPRIDRELLKKHSKGLYGLSACLGGVVNKTYLKEGEAKAAEVARTYQDLFEPGHFFLELQDNGLSAQQRANQALLAIGEHYDIPMVATADAHYLRPEDSAAHEILMCIGHGQNLQDFRAKMQHSDLLYVRSAAEMWASMGSLCPAALENTVRIAQSCHVELNLHDKYLPSYGVPAGMSRESYLEQIARQGLATRLRQASYAVDVATYQQRLDYELGVITNMGFAGYFLIVWDFIRFAKETAVPVGPGRGSGAGSLVAWCLRITDLDPIPYDLLFERFLNPERVSMPDFDIDFCQDRRGEVLRYVSQKYGENNVGQIVTYSQLSAKSVIKDVGRVLQLPFSEVNALTKLIPNLVNGKKVSIAQALQLEPKLRSIQQEKPIYAQVIQIAQALEGLNRQTGMHAAGIVIGDRPLWEYVPVLRGKDQALMTQFAKDEVEEAGLVKFDFLGLKTLTVIANAEAHVRALPGDHTPDTAAPHDAPVQAHATFQVSLAPLNDPKVYQLLASGDTDGVFQLESSGFKELLKRLRPDCFEDIVAAVALYRPGPLDAGMVDDYIARKHGRKNIVYPHPACEAVLKTTYGVLVYQEQVMRIAVVLSGFTLAQADLLRKAMGKKKSDVMAQMRQQFVDGAARHANMPQTAADALFTQIEKFAGYAFNKSHSAAYALISYQTAYLKTYFPVQFMAALLSTEMGNQDNVVRYIGSAREHKITILPPCVNLSGRDFTVVPTRQQPVATTPPTSKPSHTHSILFGLGAVKGIGNAAIDSICSSRQGRPFSSLDDFCARVDLKKVNRRVLEALIKSGGFAALQVSRAQLLAQLENALDIGQKAQQDRLSGQISLFARLESQPRRAAHRSGTDTAGQTAAPQSVAEWSDRQRLRCEKEALGFYITGHPLDSYVHDLPRLCTANTASLNQSFKNGAKNRCVDVALGGVVVGLRERPLKSGSGRMAFVTLEDLHGSCEVLVFSKVFSESEAYLKDDEPVLVHGSLFIDGETDDDSGGALKLRAARIEPLSEARRRQAAHVHIHLDAAQTNHRLLTQLKKIFQLHHGPVPIHVSLAAAPLFTAELQVGAALNVSPTEALLLELSNLLGKNAVRLT